MYLPISQNHEQKGSSFSMPYIIDGLQVSGDPFFVECFDNDFTQVEACQDLQVCVTKGTSWHKFVVHALPERKVTTFDTFDGFS